ncbi:hypothetical protein PR202_gb23372 [Eleusine coracana subsp. coracana]|uniref:Uncharacterized protein n=1 Tax=Eleusine coracana subsp. coracana TaxID=191504 RepID=A0AAV5FIU0_ELECO|nr:hypothetical protein PR202_gb23372 [Eleusine coracana subsp. coracana]
MPSTLGPSGEETKVVRSGRPGRCHTARERGLARSGRPGRRCTAGERGTARSDRPGRHRRRGARARPGRARHQVPARDREATHVAYHQGDHARQGGERFLDFVDARQRGG